VALSFHALTARYTANIQAQTIMLGVVISVALALSLWFFQGQRSGIRRNGKRLP